MFIVAEIGSNWEGDMDKAVKLIINCKRAGADAVKFQMWRAEDLYDGKYKEYELTFIKASQIRVFCDIIGIEFFCSVFYPEAVDFLEKLDVKRYKLASRTLTMKDPYSSETVIAINNTHKPIIYSNGFDVLVVFNGKELYCIPKYPANPDDIDWKKALKCDGFSDHTLGIKSALKYAKLKLDGIIEKHVKLEDSKGPDASFSITTEELADLISQIK